MLGIGGQEKMETEYIEKQLVLSKSRQDYIGGRYGYDDFVLVSDIESIPPAAVRPAVQGRWEWKHRHRGGFRRVTGEDDFGVRHTITVDEQFEIDDPYCPYCGKPNESVYLNFCPHCGADMRGGDAE